MSGTDPSLYRISKVVHNHTLYNNVDDFLQAWKAGHTVKSPPEDPFDWATRVRRKRDRPLDDRPGPRSFLPGGARYRVDEKEQWVSWMGWELFIGFERDMGVHLWDM
jgi:primary-amine oxidase